MDNDYLPTLVFPNLPNNKDTPTKAQKTYTISIYTNFGSCSNNNQKTLTYQLGIELSKPNVSLITNMMY